MCNTSKALLALAVILIPVSRLSANRDEVAGSAEDRCTRILLFMNTSRPLEMTHKLPIRHLLNDEGKVILDLAPIKNRTQASVNAEVEYSRIASFSAWDEKRA